MYNIYFDDTFDDMYNIYFDDICSRFTSYWWSYTSLAISIIAKYENKSFLKISGVVFDFIN